VQLLERVIIKLKQNAPSVKGIVKKETAVRAERAFETRFEQFKAFLSCR
jgi:uncharacterized MAPEG superfamily protein